MRAVAGGALQKLILDIAIVIDSLTSGFSRKRSPPAVRRLTVVAVRINRYFLNSDSVLLL